MASDSSSPFAYPLARTIRRHGPAGYLTVDSYRPWLRDEFSFRCVYCLLREQWGRVTAEFELDHFVAQALDSAGTLVYENLLYSCRACNLRKGKVEVPNPWVVMVRDHVAVQPDGTMRGGSPDAERLIRYLCLNSPAWRQWRRTWMRIVELAAQHDPELLDELLRYPSDLPDLAACRAPENLRPEGISQSHHSRRERGDLPATY